MPNTWLIVTQPEIEQTNKHEKSSRVYNFVNWIFCDLCPGLVTCDLRFVPTDTGTMAVDQAHFPLESDEEMAETNDTPPSPPKKRLGNQNMDGSGHI